MFLVCSDVDNIRVDDLYGYLLIAARTVLMPRAVVITQVRRGSDEVRVPDERFVEAVQNDAAVTVRDGLLEEAWKNAFVVLDERYILVLHELAFRSFTELAVGLLRYNVVIRLLWYSVVVRLLRYGVAIELLRYSVAIRLFLYSVVIGLLRYGVVI
ncbi:hypothetical protein GE09DRAFT_1148006 [Coniochaeta sp. 2T2.1]|nr:hypothetical protein GE09DRAFT_1148006 [Coniochaeta sp. 2T2.1]